MHFKLELDLHVYYVPPMVENRGGIVLTRTIDLPFVPSPEISIYSSAFEEAGPDPLGFRPKDIVWDADRQVFLAHTEHISHNFPWPYIVSEIQNWVQHGWRLGSYVDTYEAKWRAQEQASIAAAPRRREKSLPDDDLMEQWPSMPPKERPKHFNQAFGIITRMLADTHNAESVAYAMHRTQMYFNEEQLKGDLTPAMRRFQEARNGFYKEPYRKRERQIKRIRDAYPSLADVIKVSLPTVRQQV